VSRAELGSKRLCGSCGTKFYDVLKNPIVCPRCSTVFVPPPVSSAKPRRGGEYARPRAAATVEAADIGSDKEVAVDVAVDDVKEEKELNEMTDDGSQIVLDEEDEDGQGVGDMLGGDVKKDGPS
jgi:uncharacterized protein (TIGR02300 family)